MKYPRTVAKLTEWIVALYPDALQKLTPEKAAEFKDGKGEYWDGDLPTYLLWMMQESETFDDREKAARWLAWVFGKIDPRPVLRIANVSEVMDLVRADKEEAPKEWPKFLVHVSERKKSYLTLEAAAMALEFAYENILGDEVLECDYRIRPITAQEVALIHKTAHGYGAAESG